MWFNVRAVPSQPSVGFGTKHDDSWPQHTRPARSTVPIRGDVDGLDVNFAISLLMRRASAACFPLPEDTGSVWHYVPEDARALSALATTGVRVVPVTG